MTTKKTVLFLITKGTWGGAQRYVFDLATHLPPESFTPLVAYGTKGRLSEKLQESGVPTEHLPSLGRNIALVSDVWSFFEILRVLKKHRPDVLHLNSSKAALLGALAGRVLGIKRIVFTAHGWPFKENRNFITKWFFYMMSWKTALMSHAVIVVSETDKKMGAHMPFVGKKVYHVPLGIESPQFLPREMASSSLSINAASPRAVTIAELTPNKGIRYAIEAVALLKEKGEILSYSIIGDGEERSALEALARQKGVSDHVRFFGFVKDAVQYLHAFDVFLLPSLKEGSPYVLLEAQWAGLPIIATEAVDVPVSVRVPIADASRLADALGHTPLPLHASIPSLANMVQDTVPLY